MGIYKFPASGLLSSSLKWSLVSSSLPVLSIPESLKESQVRTKFLKRKKLRGWVEKESACGAVRAQVDTPGPQLPGPALLLGQACFQAPSSQAP